jgi:hypothetical protein
MSEPGPGERATGRPAGGLHLAELAFLAALPVVALFPALVRGFPAGHDWLFELVRVAEFRHAIAEGQLLPLWGPNLYFGFGSPIFLFYAPLYAATSSAIGACGVPIHVATVLSLLVFGWIGAASAWKLGSELSGGAAGAVAGRLTAAFYLLSPYLLGDALERNANAELTALFLAPMPLFGVALTARRPRAGAAVVAVGIALVVFAHNLTALTVAAAALLLALILHGSRERRRALAASATGLAFGVCLAAPFWLAAIGHGDEVRQSQVTAGKFDFHNNFEPFAAFVGGGEFFSPGPVAVLMLLLVLGALVAKGRTIPRLVRPLVASLALAAASIALLSPLSIPAWEHAPFLRLFQFPWRFCGTLALATAIGVGPAASAWLESRPARLARLAELALLLLFVVAAVPRWLAYEPLPAEVRRNAETALTPATIRARGMPATVVDDYLPPGGDRALARHFFGRAPVVLAIEGDASADVTSATGSRIELAVAAREEARLALSRWASPVWIASVDGRTVPVERAPNGCVAVRIPRGESRVIVKVAQPPLRRLGLAIGLAALIAGATLLVRRRDKIVDQHR